MTLQKTFQRLVLCLVATLFVNFLSAQCPLTVPYSLNDVAQTQTCGTTVETSTLVTTHSTCIYAGEYSSLINTINGTTYCFKTTTDDYLTIYEENQALVLGSGQGEVCVVAVSDTLFVQINLSSACDVQIGTCKTLESICQDCPPLTNMGCTDPLALNYIPCAIIDDGSCAYPDAGDSCIDAEPLVVNIAGCVTNNIAVFDNHTQSSGVANCEPFNNNEYYDKWFTHTTGTSGALIFSSLSGFGEIDIYRNNCGNLESIICDPSSGDVLTGWLPNEQLYIRAYSTDNTSNTFEFCIEETCAPWFEITDGECTSNTEFELELTVNDLGGSSSYNVIVYTSDLYNPTYVPGVVVNATGTYTISNIPSNATSIQLLGVLVTACQNSKEIFYNCDCFDTAPENDLCVDAEQLMVTPFNCYYSTFGTLDCATWEGDDFSCDYYYYYYYNYNPYQYYGNSGPKDVWYSFVVPASGSIGIDIQSISYYYYANFSVTLLNGTCGNFTEIDCFYSYGGIYDSANSQTTQYYSLTPGDIIFVKIAGSAGIGIDGLGKQSQNDKLVSDNDENRLQADPQNNNNQSQILDFAICVWEDYKGSECLTDMNINQFIPNGNYPVSNTITSNGYTLEGSEVNLKAGQSIELTDGFSAEYDFSAEIEDCDIYYYGPPTDTVEDVD